MGKNYYQPTNNYERNFLMVKKFGGKFSVLILPVLFFASIACSCYLAMFDGQMLEITILKVVTSKLNLELDFGCYEKIISFVGILISAFCVFCLFYIFFKSKNSDFYSSPDFGYSLLHKFSVAEMLISVVGFISMIVITATFMFGSPERFEAVGKSFNMTVDDLKAYKLTIVILLFVADIILFLMIWYAQSQTDFIKSIRSSLVESVPKNKGAHTYGVFSMAIAIMLIASAVFLTFMYYCYKDAFSGFGISIDETYVYVSLARSYIKGLITFFLAVDAFSYSAMVDESNSIGGLMFNDYRVLGEAEDPNMAR